MENEVIFPKKRKENFSPNEINLLITLVEQNRHLLFSKFDNQVDFKKKSLKWKEITQKINACGNHNVRTEGEVKKKWQDLKKQAKAKESQRRVYMRGTGGGPPPKDLSDVELKIIQIIPDVIIDGILGGTDTAENVTETCHEIACEPENIDAELPIASTSTCSEESRAAAIDIRTDPDYIFVKPKEDLKRKKKTVDEELIRIEEEKLALKRQKLHVLMDIQTSLQELVQLKRHELVSSSTNESENDISLIPVIKM